MFDYTYFTWNDIILLKKEGLEVIANDLKLEVDFNQRGYLSICRIVWQEIKALQSRTKESDILLPTNANSF